MAGTDQLVWELDELQYTQPGRRARLCLVHEATTRTLVSSGSAASAMNIPARTPEVR
jgi:hypothetical protein